MAELLLKNYTLDWLENIPLLAKISNIYGHCIGVNKYWSSYTGKSDQEELGIGWVENVFADDYGNYQEIYEKALKSYDSYTLELRIMNKDKEFQWFREFGKPLFDDLGKYVGYISVYTDISTQKAEINELSNLLKNRDLRIREIIHRMKNNMAVISGMFDLHMDYIESQNDQAVLQSFHQRVISMILIDENFYQSNPSSRISFKQFVEDVVKRISNSYKGSKVMVSLHIEIDEGDLELGKAVPCGLILNELIRNAYKHAFEHVENGKLLISFLKKSEKYILVVSDNGMGITDETLISDPKTLGYTFVNALTRQLNGKLETESLDGLCVKIIF